MLMEELQQALDFVICAFEAEDVGPPEAALPHLQQAHALLTYARGSLSTELDLCLQCLVDQVLCSIMDTMEAFATRLQDLKARCDEAAAAAMPCEALCAVAATHGDVAAWAQQQQPHAQQHQQQQRASLPLSASSKQSLQLPLDATTAAAAAAQHPHHLGMAMGGGGGGGGCGDADGEGTEAAGSTAAAAESVDILHQCQRVVSGTLAEVSGLQHVKQELIESVLWPLRLPSLFKGYRKPPKSFLFAGPPGTGKTMLIEKLAAESGMTMLAITPSTCLSKWSGESEKTIRSVFAAASSMQPSIVFIDEIDALAGQRSSGDDAASRRLLTELLLQMTGVAGQDVYLFACTNRIQDCDAALLRRFERRIFVPLPDAAARTAYFTRVLQRPEMTHALTQQDVADLVERTQGYSCSDLQGVCRSAAMLPVREVMTAHAAVLNAALACPSSSSSSGGGPDASVAETWADQGPADESALRYLVPRALCLRDFVDALELIRPTDVDQDRFALA